MKTFLTFSLLFAIFHLSAQIEDNVTWCPPGATWIYLKNTGNLMGIVSTSQDYHKYVYEKDTAIIGLNFKKINQFSFSEITEHLAVNTNVFLTEDNYKQSLFLHQTNDSIFYLNENDSLIFLYSFNTVLNDKWETTKNDFSFIDQYPLSCDTVVSYTDSITVTNKNQDTINNIIFKFDKTTSKLEEWKLQKIYKNIGSDLSFFPTPYMHFADTCDMLLDVNNGYNKEIALVVYYDDIRKYSFNKNYNTAYYLMTNIEKLVNQQNFKIFPNPTSQKLIISNQKNKQDLKIEVLNVLGQKIYASSTPLKEEVLDLEKIGLKKGNYFIKLNIGNEILIYKIVYN